MFKMGSHCSFGHLKHKLWPKEGPGVKLTIWLPTRKSWESTRFTWLETSCNIPLESSRRELQLSSDCTSIWGLLAKLWGSKIVGVPANAISGLPLGNPGREKPFGCSPMERCRVYYKGEGGGFPQVRAVVSLVCPCCSWLVLAPKVFQLCTNLMGCVQACVSEWSLSTLPSPIPELQHAPLPFKVLRAKERASTFPPSDVLYLDSLLNLAKSWECIT